MFITTATLIFITQFIYLKSFTFHKDNECIKEAEPLTVEFYTKDDSLFILVSEQVAWFEAVSICKYYEASLCMANTTDKAEFIGRFLTESNFRFEDFWLGAKYTKQEWTWMDGQLLKDSKLSVIGPLVLEDHATCKDCLAIERSNHYTPIFVAMSCHLLKPFICERSISARTNKPLPALPTQTVRINDSIFTIYHSRTSWNEALAFCRTIGQRLAVIPDNTIVKILRSAMLRTRPNMENAWIGASYYQKSWMWISTGNKIPMEKQADGYPPWIKSDLGKYTDGCVLFDRHFTSAYFVPENCQRRRDFICEQYVHTANLVNIDNNTFPCFYKNITMRIYLVDKTWEEANAFCDDNVTGLAEPYDYEALSAIVTCLGDHPAEPRHVWLGGKFMDPQWVWVKSKKEVDPSLPWCEDEFELDSQCLNLDRTDHDKPWIYGLQCTKRQPFVCADVNQNDDIRYTTTPVPTTPGTCVCPCEQPPIPMHLINATYTAFMFNVKATDIFEHCLYFGGAPFTTALSKAVQNYVLSYIRLSVDYCGCCTADAFNFWVKDKANSSSAAINLGSNKIVHTKNNSIKRPFICQIFCNETPPIKTNENATINCEWIKAAGKLPYRNCKFTCGFGYSLFGPDRFDCDYYGWKIHTVEDVTPFRYPECIKVLQTAKHLLKVLNEIEKHGLYFAIRESETMDRSAWITILQFIMSIIQIFPISDDFFFGLLTFSSTVSVRFPYEATNTCTVLETLRDMNVTDGAEKTRYDLALLQIQNELQKKQSSKSLIFFIADKQNTGDDYDVFAKELHSNNTIFVIGVTTEKFVFDLDLVASVGKTFRLYTMKVEDYNSLANISLELLGYRSKKLHCPPNLYTMHGLTPRLEDSQHLPKRDIDVVQQNVAFYVIKNYVPYEEAKAQCRTKYGGSLISDTRSHGLFIYMNLKQFQVEHFWIQQGSQCVIAEVFTHKFKPSGCNNKHAFVCVIDCSFLPPINIHDNLDNIEEEPHSFDCYQKDETLWGPSDLQCNSLKGGWITSGHRKSPFPTCLSASRFVKNMLLILSSKRQEKKAGILFVLDESKSVLEEQFQIQLKFVKNIIKLFPASQQLPYGLITVSKVANVRIPYQAKDSCTYLRELSTIKLNTLGDVTDYVGAIQLVDKQISDYRSDQATIVYFITNGLFVGEILNVKRAIGNLLKWNVEIFALKVGQFDSEVISEIPTRDSNYNFNLFNIPSYSTFNKLANKLLKEAEWSPLICK